MTSQTEALNRAAGWLRKADGLLITAGAGMGVDSGLPDFRGTQGLWAAYPALGHAKIPFESIANPKAFAQDPALAWGFYGHRLALYRTIEPHEGFTILKRWADRMAKGSFVYTSNVDGQFQKAGFSENSIVECHGSIHYLQCLQACSADIWSAAGFFLEVDEHACRLTNPFPRCSRCSALARPNVLMFGDWAWLESRTERQQARLKYWLGSIERLVVVEIGAGTGLSTVRRFSERHGPRVIRINAREPAIDGPKGVGIQGRAVEVLSALNRLWDI
ncbi:SIR2 family NAD-dependent protein deacylase [Paraburkholderia sp. RL17-337-BIB-A]|uniref:SIR2 family NAD-dependent protein deacylase n=1 Tax=Paraburkholderia sp. RL17-337-BIB-A TaxID=3031636 RepID=UPI0038B8E599